eukprot:5395747-Pyramimonas_sp.AAC.1
MDLSPGRRTMRGTHGALLHGGNLDITVAVANWRAGRNVRIPHVTARAPTPRFQVVHGPQASTPTKLAQPFPLSINS